MPNAIKWSALGTFTEAIGGATTAPTLKALANNGQKVGNAIDNSAVGARNQYADFELKCRFTVAPSTGGNCELYFIQSVDGTNYQDGDDSVAPPSTALVGVFPVRAVTTQQRVAVRGITLPATPFKPLIINKAGQAMTNTDNENVLSYRAYSDELQ